MEKLITENQKLREQVKSLTAELERCKETDGAVLNTLEAAKSLMNDISASAEKRAEILLKNAQLDADLIQREAKENAERLTEESKSLQERVSSFRSRFRHMLEIELERFDALSEELFSDRDFEDLSITLAHSRSVLAEEEAAAFAEGKTMVNLRKPEE